MAEIRLDIYTENKIDIQNENSYIESWEFELIEKPSAEIAEPIDAIVRVTLGSICACDLHFKHGSVPRAVPGVTVGHEMVGVVG